MKEDHWSIEVVNTTLNSICTSKKKESLSVFLKATRVQDAIVSTVHRWGTASQKDVNLTNID